MTALPPLAHLSDDVLVDYAAGTLPQATALLVRDPLGAVPRVPGPGADARSRGWRLAR